MCIPIYQDEEHRSPFYAYIYMYIYIGTTPFVNCVFLKSVQGADSVPAMLTIQTCNVIN